MPAIAEETVVPPEAQKIIEESGTDASSVSDWQFGDLFSGVVDIVTGAIKEPSQFCVQATLYLGIACISGLLATGEWKKFIDVVCVMGFGAISLAAVTELTGELSQTVQEGQSYLINFMPVYSGIVLLGGQPAGAAAYSGLFFTVSAFLSGMIGKILVPVMMGYFCLAASASVWALPGIEQAAFLFSNGLRALLKYIGLFLGFVLGLQGALASSTDRAAFKIGKSVLSVAVPLVGDAAAAALDSAAATLGLLKGALALAAVVSLGTVFAPLAIKCALYSLAFFAAGLLATASGQSRCGSLCKSFAEGTQLCLSMVVLYFFIVLIATALLLIAGGGA